MNKKIVINRLKILLIVVMFGSLWLTSCDDPICDKIKRKLDSIECTDSKCQLDLKDLFNENWNQLYIFHGFNTPEDISNAIGFEYNGEAIYDHTRLILEVANNKILKASTTECLILNIDRVLENGYYKKDSNNSFVTLISSGNANNQNYIISD